MRSAITRRLFVLILITCLKRVFVENGEELIFIQLHANEKISVEFYMPQSISKKFCVQLIENETNQLLQFWKWQHFLTLVGICNFEFILVCNVIFSNCCSIILLYLPTINYLLVINQSTVIILLWSILLTLFYNHYHIVNKL